MRSPGPTKGARGSGPTLVGSSIGRGQEIHDGCRMGKPLAQGCRVPPKPRPQLVAHGVARRSRPDRLLTAAEWANRWPKAAVFRRSPGRSWSPTASPADLGDRAGTTIATVAGGIAVPPLPPAPPDPPLPPLPIAGRCRRPRRHHHCHRCRRYRRPAVAPGTAGPTTTAVADVHHRRRDVRGN